MLSLKMPFRILMSLTFLGVFLFLASCDDDEPEGQTLTGQYKFVSASLRTAVTVNGQIIPAGTDITDQIAEGLFGAVTCADPANTAIDLQSTGSLFFICLNESVTPVQGGTWEGTDSNTRLVLSLSAPPFPQAIQATVQGLAFDGDLLSGYILNLPLPGSSLGSSSPFVLINVDIVFEVQ